MAGHHGHAAVADRAVASHGETATPGRATPPVTMQPLRPRTLCYVKSEDGTLVPGVVVEHSVGSDSAHPRHHYYVHIEGTDKRLDRWVDEDAVSVRDGKTKVDGAPKASENGADTVAHPPATGKAPSATALGKRKRPEHLNGASTSRDSTPAPHSARDPADKVRNIDRVFFGSYDIKTWYYSPYPLEDPDHDSHDGAAAASSSSSASASTSSADGKSTVAYLPSKTVRSLWVCEGCFKYMKTFAGYKAHSKSCPNKHPPGQKVYERGAHTIWKVRGYEQKLYGQNLSLFGKLFIDHKTIYFDVEPFDFYVLTDASTSFDHPIGFFSKEQISYDDYNLACIVTFPPFQKRGYGTLLMEFSYYLSALMKYQGTPERPLSDLGLKGYLSHWTSVVLRTLALALDLKGLPVSLIADDSSSATRELRLKAESKRVRRLLLGHTDEPTVPLRLAEIEGAVDAAGERRQRRKSKAASDRDGTPDQSLPPSTVKMVSPNAKAEEMQRAEAAPITIHATIDTLAYACNLRVDDVTFTLAECGLLDVHDGKPASSEDPQRRPSLLVSADAIRAAVVAKQIKRPLFDIEYALL